MSKFQVSKVLIPKSICSNTNIFMHFSSSKWLTSSYPRAQDCSTQQPPRTRQSMNHPRGTYPQAMHPNFRTTKHPKTTEQAQKSQVPNTEAPAIQVLKSSRQSTQAPSIQISSFQDHMQTSVWINKTCGYYLMLFTIETDTHLRIRRHSSPDHSRRQRFKIHPSSKESS